MDNNSKPKKSSLGDILRKSHTAIPEVPVFSFPAVPFESVSEQLSKISKNRGIAAIGSFAFENYANLKFANTFASAFEANMESGQPLFHKMRAMPAIGEAYFEARIDFSKISNAFTQVGDHFKKIIGDGLRRADKIVASRMEAIIWASSHGWFILQDIDFAEILEIDHLFQANDVDSLHEKFKTLTHQNAAAIEESLKAHFPDRVAVIDEAFCLFRENRYIACIPLFLMIAEGIGLQVTKESVFNTHRKKPEIARYIAVKQVDQTFATRLLTSLSEPHPLSDHKMGYINRHKILHGRDSTFGTEFGALQALSFLGHLDWMLDVLREDASKASPEVAATSDAAETL